MATSSSARLLFIETNAQGKTITRPIVGKVTAKAQSGFNYTVVEEASARPPAKVTLRRSGDTLIIEQDGSVVSEVENFYGEKAVTYTTDGAPSLSGSNAYITPDSTPVRPLPGGDTLVWASGEGSALLAGLTSGQAAFGVLPVLGLVAAGGGSSSISSSGSSSGSGSSGGSPVSTPDVIENPILNPTSPGAPSGLGLVTDDGIGGATVTIKYFNTSGELVDSLVVVSNDDPTDPGFGSFVVDLAALGYDYTGFITATAVGGRDIYGNALNGAVVYQVLVTDSLMGSEAAGDEYQIVLSPLTTLMFQSVVAALGGDLGDSQADIGAKLAGATDLDATIGEAAAEIVDLFGLGAYGADPLSLFNTASDFDPTRQGVERQINLLLVTLSALGSGLSDSSMVDDDSMALATGASSAAALSVLNALVAARDDAALTNDDYVFSAGNASFVQDAVKEFLVNVDLVPEVVAITGTDGLRADGGDGNDASTARIAAAIAGLGAMLAQGGENAVLAMAMVAGGDMLPDSRTSLAMLFAGAFTAATNSERDADYQGDLEFDLSELTGSATGQGVSVLDGVGGTQTGNALDAFADDIAEVIEEIYTNGDFASVVVTSQGAFINVNRDGVFSLEDAASETADFAEGGNASLAENAVTVVFTDGNADFQATDDPLDAIDENDRLEIRVQTYDYTEDLAEDASDNAYGDIDATEFQYILDKGAETTAGVGIVVKTEAPGYATLVLGDPGFSSEVEAEDFAFADGTVRSIFVEAQSDAPEEDDISSASAVIALTGEVTGSTYVQATGEHSVANLAMLALGDLTLSTLGARAEGDNSDAGLNTFIAGKLDVRGNLLLEAAGDGSRVGGLSGSFEDLPIPVPESAFIGGSGEVNFGGLVTVRATGDNADVDLTIGVLAGSITIADDVLVEASGDGSDARLTVGATYSCSDTTAEVSFGGSLTVLASEDDAYAQVNLMYANVSASDVQVTASGYSSDASLYATEGISGTINGITVTASCSDAYASAYIEGTSSCGDTLTVGGDLIVTASGTSSDAQLNLAVATLTCADITVEASDYQSYASVDLYAVSGTVGQFAIDASGTSSYAGTFKHGSSELTVGTLSITASGKSSEAIAYLGYGMVDYTNTTIGATLTVEASGISSDATLDADNAGNVTFNGTSVTVSATGDNSSAEADIYNLSGTANGITVTASGASSYVSADIQGTGNCGDTLAVGGDLIVTATGNLSDAWLTFENVTLDSVSVSVVASGNSSDAQLYASSGMTGSINGITITASSYDSYASADIEGTGNCGDTLTIGGAITLTAGYSSDAGLYLRNAVLDGATVSVTASGESSDAQLYASTGMTGSIDGITITASGGSSDACADIAGSGTCGDTLTVNGVIALTASGTSASADLNLANVTLNGGSLTVTASEYSSAASAEITNASGTISAVTVQALASSTGGSQELQGFDFFGGALSSNGMNIEVGTEVEVSIGGQYLTYTFDADDVAAYGCGDISGLLASLNEDAERDELGMIFTAEGVEGRGLYIQYADNINHPLASVTVTNGSEEQYTFGCNDSFQIDGAVAASNNNAYLNLTGDLSIAGNVTVEASGKDSLASADIYGFCNDIISIDGDITVTASGGSSEAYLYLNRVTLDSSALNVTASGTNASADLGVQASGTISDITVLASGTFAGENYAFASADITVTAGGTLSVDGNVTVTASGISSDASLNTNGVTFGGGSLTVSATAGSSDAQASLDVSLGSIDGITVSASGGYSFACADIAGPSQGNQEQQSFALYRANNSGIYFESGTTVSLTVDGQELSYLYSEESSYFDLVDGLNRQAQELELNLEFVLDEGLTLNFTDSANHAMSALTVTDDCGDSYTFGQSGDFYELDGEAASGSLTVSGQLNVDATGRGADAYLYLSGATLACADVSVTASSYDSLASADFSEVSGTINGITVTASGYYAEASADIQGTGNCGDTLTIGGVITLTASGYSSDAGLYLADVVLDGATVSVTASGESSDAQLYAYSGMTGSINGITVMASSSDAYAWADIQGTRNCGDTLTVGGAITLTASSYSSEAGLYLQNMVVEGATMSVTASGESSDATLYAYSGMTGSINGITVTASGASSEASADIQGTGNCGDMLTVGDAITLTASGFSSDAGLYLRNALLDGATVSVTATGNSSDAQLYASSGMTGSINGISVSAGATGVFASAFAQNFSMDGGTNYIINGSNDAYDNGNYISLTGLQADAIDYLLDTVVADTFGVGSERVVVHNEALFGLMVTGNTEGMFSVLGGMGADGKGIEDLVELSSYGGYSATVCRTHSAGDTSVNRLFIYQTNPDVLVAGLDGDTNTEDFTITGLDGVDHYGYFVAYRGDSEALTETQLQEMFEGLVDSVMGQADAAAMRDAFYTGYDALTSGVLVETYGMDQYASADIQGTGNCGDTLTVCGDITVTASGYSSDAGLYLRNAVLDGATVSVTASGESSDAVLRAYSGMTGSINGITVTASGYSADASADIQGTGNCGDTLTVGGNITVTASGYSADAGLYLEDVVLDGATVSVTASGYSSDAQFSADTGISGTVSSITVTASGFSSNASADIAGEDGQPEVQSFNIFNNADLASATSGASLDTLVVSFGDQDLSYTVACGDYAEFMNGDFSAIVDALQAQANAADMDVTVGIDSSVALSITYNNTADQTLAGVTLTSVCGDIYTFDPASSYVSVTEAVNPASLTVTNAVTVTASGESSEAYLELRDVELDGITVAVDASGASSEAILYANYGMSGTITELSVTATGGVIEGGDYGAIASADIGTGGWWTPLDRSVLTIDHLTLEASGQSSEAYAVLTNLTLTQNLGVSDLEVLATGTSSEANLWTSSVDATANNLLVQAGGSTSDEGIYTRHANAEASFEDDSNLDVLGDITVAAYGNDGDAELNVSNGSHIAILDATVTVVAAAFSSDAYMYLESATGQINEFTVTATGDSSEASAFISGYVQFGTIFTVTAAGHNSDASAEVQGGSYWEDVAGQDMDFVSTALLVQATGSSTEADLSVLDGTGSLASVTVTASGYSAEASADIDFSGMLAGNIIVTASASSSEASLSMTAGRRAELQVTAGSYNSYYGEPTGIQVYYSGDVVLLSIGGTDYSYTVQSGDDFSDVTAGLQTALAADGITVWHDYSENTYYSSFRLIWDEQGYLDDADREVSLSVTRIADQTVVAGAYNEWYDNGRGADANLIQLGEDTDVLVTASGFSSDAYVNLDYLSGVVDHVTVSATGSSNFSEDGTDADAWLRFDAHAGGHITTGLIETGDYADAAVSSRATLRLSQTDSCGDVTVTGDGFATLVIRSEDVNTINLAGLHSAQEGADDRWGVFDLVFAQEDRQLATSSFSANNLMTVTGFDEARDAFNSATPYDDTRFNWGEDSNSSNNVFYSEDETRYTVGCDDGYATFAELATWASGVLDARADINNPGYFFGTYGNTGDGYLFYDRSGSGLTDVVKLAGVTSFDAINVAQHQSVYTADNGTQTVSATTSYSEFVYERDYDDRGSSAAFNLQFDNARMEDVLVSAYMSTANLSLSSGTEGSLMFRQGEVKVTASTGTVSDWRQLDVGTTYCGDANLDIHSADGTIDHLYVQAYGSSDNDGDYFAEALASISCGDIELRELTLDAGYKATASAVLSGLAGNIQQLTLSVDGDDALAAATITMGADATSHIERVDFNAGWTYIGDTSTMNLNVYQGTAAVGAHGGVVYAQAEGSGDVTANLAYFGGGRAGEIHLGYATVSASGSADTYLFNFDSSDTLVTNRAFNLSVNVSDADLDISTDVTQLLDDRLQIWGSDLGTLIGDDTIRFTTALGSSTTCGDYAESETVATSIDQFLTNAEAALDGTTDFYFGVVDTDGDAGSEESGYLAYDDDGTGLTMLIEFNGMTSFDQDRLNVLIGNPT